MWNNQFGLETHKYWLLLSNVKMRFAFLLCLVVLVTGCVSSPTGQIILNETDNNTYQDSLKEDVDELVVNNVVIEQVEEEQDVELVEVEDEPVNNKLLDIENTLDISVLGPQLLKTTFVEDEKHELRLLLKDVNSVEKASLRFFPACSDGEGVLQISFNKFQIMYDTPSCDEVNIVSIPLEVLEEGKNIILFASHVKEDYLINDVTVELEFSDGRSNRLEGEAFLLKHVNNPQESIFENLEPVELKNYFEQSFKLSKKESQEPFYLVFTGSKTDDLLRIDVNEHVIFSGPVKKDMKIFVPAEVTVEGSNSMSFVGVSR